MREQVVAQDVNKNICIFDYHTLPHSLIKEDTFDKICVLKEQNKDIALLKNFINDLIKDYLISMLLSKIIF